MMVMTAKVDRKKILLVIVAAAALVLSAILLFGGGKEDAATIAQPQTSNNDARVQFLKGFGWEVTTSPTETGQVKIPKENTEVFDRYNSLQKSQGYDLTDFAGKTVMRFVYKVENYPEAAEPVYATLLVYKNKIIGGDVTDTAAKGKIQGFKMPKVAAETPAQPASEPTETTQSAAAS